MSSNQQIFDLQELVSSHFDQVVAVEPGPDGQAELFIRDHDQVTKKIIPFHPFILLNNPH